MYRNVLGLDLNIEHQFKFNIGLSSAWPINQTKLKILDFLTSSTSNIIYKLGLNSNQACTFYISYWVKHEHSQLNKTQLVYCPKKKSWAFDFILNVFYQVTTF